jgi:hypothetical protein
VKTAPFTNGFIAMLRAQVDGDGDPLRIGDAQAPESSDGVVEMPYAAVYPRDGNEMTGESLRNPHTHVELIYEVRSVGYKREAAEYMRDLIRTAVLGRNASSTAYANAIAATGIGIARRWVVFGSVTREGTIWNASDEFGFRLVPA